VGGVADLVDVGGPQALLAVGEQPAGGVGWPSRYGRSGWTPAVVNKTEGSPSGMREALGRMACPRSAKNARNIDRSLSASSIPTTVAPCQL
jgi:hypothetical protein